MPKLNILKHKSWHVGNQQNIDRVKRDERVAAEQDQQEQDRQRQVESERRLEILRQRARNRTPKSSSSDLPQVQPEADTTDEKAAAPERFRLFDEPKRATATPNPEFVAEQRRAEERWQVRNNARWRLDEGAKNVPWYASSSSQQIQEERTSTSFRGRNESTRQDREARRKMDEDPWSQVRRHLDASKKPADEPQRKPQLKKHRPY